jgi:peptide/nickel transport system substrate-binding protein
MQELFKKFINFLVRAYNGLRMLGKIRMRHVPQILESLNKRDFAVMTISTAALILAGGFLVQGYMYAGDGIIPTYGGEHIEGLVGQPRFINPVLAPASGVDSDLSRIIYAQLLKFDKDLNLKSDLAQDLPAVSADQRTYTIKLKPNLKWQDGKPLTSNDVVFTIQTIQNPAFESPLLTNWNRVRVEKIDDITVKFTLHEISASFITNFTLGIIPKHVWEGLSPNNFRLSDNNLRPVGSGPYMVRQIKKTPDGTVNSLTLKSNEAFHEGTPFITFVTFKFYPDFDHLISAYQSKDILSLGFIPFDKKVFLESKDNINQYQINLPQYQAVFFNLPKNSVVADKAVRQALALSTERRPIIDDVYLGYAQEAYGPIVKGNLGYNPSIEETTHFNLEEAGAILDKAGWVLDNSTNTRYKNIKSGTNQIRQNLEFTLATNILPLNVKTAQILQSQWAKIGVTANLAIVSAADLDNQYIRTRNFDALLFSENTGADPDPFAFWHSSQARDPGLNLSGFNNAQVDKLLTDARQTNDVEARIKSYQTFQTIVTQEIPAIFLNSAVYVYNMPKKQQGFDLDTMIYAPERFLDINHWYVETRRE